MEKYLYFFTPKSTNSLKFWIKIIIMMIQLLFFQFSIFNNEKYLYFFTPKSTNSLKFWIKIIIMMIQLLFFQFSIFNNEKYLYFFTPKFTNLLKLLIKNNRYDDSATLFSTFDLRPTTKRCSENTYDTKNLKSKLLERGAARLSY